jgi:hypothetical protein
MFANMTLFFQFNRHNTTRDCFSISESSNSIKANGREKQETKKKAKKGY